MSRDSIEQLVERWMEDTAFRAAVRKDPEATVRATGLELTADEWAAVRNLDWSLSDDELSARASKSGGVADGC
jgi:predicted ribosomally synthesized peptide with nif11-like leader